MPRIRTLKPEFFTSPDVGAVDYPVRLFYQALWCWADDFGIGETNLNGLLGFAFCDGDQIYDEALRGFRAISAQDLRHFCADVAQHFGTAFYTVRGRHYYAIETWDDHQKTERREQRRKHPLPTDPDAVPDQRIYGCATFAPEVPRKNGANPRETGAGTGEQGNRGTGEQGTTTARDATPIDGRGKALARVEKLNAAATSPASWDITRQFTGQDTTPLDEQSKIAAAVEKCLRSGIQPDQVIAGLRLWAKSDSWAPSQIGTFVSKAAQKAAHNGRGKPTEKAVATGDAAESLIADMEIR
jgi:hypothetical protein